MSRFPHLPETFILREMVELQTLGWDVHVYPLVVQRQAVVHPEAQQMLANTHPIPYLSPGVAWENLRTFVEHPLRYLSTFLKMVWENRTSPKFLLRAVAIFPKAVAAGRDMQRRGIQHVHAHYATHPALAAWIIYRLMGIHYTFTVHAHDIYVERPMLASKLAAANFVVSISAFNREYLAREVGPWVRQKIRVLHCGVAPERYPGVAPERYPGGTQDTPPAGAPLRVLNVGSLQTYKGQRYLIQAVALLRRRGIPVHAVIVGEGELRPELQGLIAENGLSDTVELLGARTQEEVAGLLPEADCYAQPSVVAPSGKMEGIPVALMEALASRLPVVATRISGVPELVRPGVTGLLVEAEDVPGLADALEQIYRDPLAAARRAQAGRELVLSEFNLHHNVRILSQLFDECVHLPEMGRNKPQFVAEFINKG
ncbi:MAG: glycosyltransferase family 4 protein [Anaerolineaceae bacterium]|nr:glycosyltransferase family 4 protein [Anaerolineaceae bacterium]